MTKFDKNKAHDQYSFLKHRREQERLHWENADFTLIDSILTVEINTTELCNRTCIFCPRHDPSVYPNQNLNMSMEVANRIASELASNKFQGKISFSGFGENLLNKNFPQIISLFRDALPDSMIECNTNGDKLTLEGINTLIESGMTIIYINLYDGKHQIDHFDRLFRGIPKKYFKYRKHYGSSKDHGLILNNRSGNVTLPNLKESEIHALNGTRCFYPFYKMFIDWNGDVLFCSNDWGRERIVGNLTSQSLYDVWFSEGMNEVRKKLIQGNRGHSPCNKCNVTGTLFGQKSFELLREYYESIDNRKN